MAPITLHGENMPTAQAQAVDNFINQYEEYVRYAQFASDWVNKIIAIVPLLQADPNYTTSLTPEEQTAVSANLVAAQGTQIKPIPSNIPPIPPIISQANVL